MIDGERLSNIFSNLVFVVKTYVNVTCNEMKKYLKEGKPYFNEFCELWNEMSIKNFKQASKYTLSAKWRLTGLYIYYTTSLVMTFVSCNVSPIQRLHFTIKYV